MAHWCLQYVNYDAISFRPKTTPASANNNKAPGASVTDDNMSDSGIESLYSPRSSYSTSAELSPTSTTEASELSSPRGDVIAVSTGTAWVVQNFRDVINNRERHREIPQIIANWPTKTFRLSAIASQTEIEQCLDNPDRIWQLIFHGLLISTTYCKITCLDLTGFIPSKGLLYTMLQLLPFLSLTPDNLDKKVIYDLVVSNLGLNDDDLLQNLDKYLETSLSHKVYHRGKRITFPEGRLTVILDYLPLSADKLNHLCYLTAVGMQDMTKVTIIPRSIIYRYTEVGSEFTPFDPLLPLLATRYCSLSTNFVGLSVADLPEERTEFVLGQLDEPHLSPYRSVRHLSFSHCGLCLSGAHRVHLTSLLSSLSLLTRLDLSGARAGGRLGEVMEALPSPLEYLNLSSCRVQPPDLENLAASKHSASLRDLNLAYLLPPPCKSCQYHQRLNSSDHSSPVFDDPIQHSVLQRGSLDDPSDFESQLECKHSTWDKTSKQTACDHMTIEADFYEGIVRSLKSFPSLVLLDISSTICRFRVSHETLLLISECILLMKQLKQLTVEGVPLWDDDIFDIVATAAAQPHLHSLILTRSEDAPTLQMTDKFEFWKRMHRVKRGKFIRTAIANFVDEYLYELPDSDDETSVFESISSLDG